MKNTLPSKKQYALLQFIDGFIAENNYAPSYREVMKALDYKSVSTVANHINGLIERGWLEKRDNSARSVEVIYKMGEGTSLSAAPSLSAAHEQWLLERIKTQLAASEHWETDMRTLCDALAILGFSQLRDQISEQTQPDQSSDGQADTAIIPAS